MVYCSFQTSSRWSIVLSRQNSLIIHEIYCSSHQVMYYSWASSRWPWQVINYSWTSSRCLLTFWIVYCLFCLFTVYSVHILYCLYILFVYCLFCLLTFCIVCLFCLFTVCSVCLFVCHAWVNILYCFFICLSRLSEHSVGIAQFDWLVMT